MNSFYKGFQINLMGSKIFSTSKMKYNHSMKIPKKIYYRILALLVLKKTRIYNIFNIKSMNHPHIQFNNPNP